MRDRLAENSHRLRTKNIDMAALILTRGMRALIWEVAEERPEYLESEALREELLRLFQSYLIDPVTH